MEGVETRMVGRDAELGTLQEAFTWVIQNHERAAVVVIGEAGLGKSRLLYEFENWADLQPTDMQALYRGRGRLETQQQAYGLLRDLFAFRCGIFDDDAAEAAREKLVGIFRAELGAGDAVEMKAHLIGHLLGYDFGGSP